MSWTIGGECSKSSSVTFQDHQIYEQTCCAQYFSGLTVYCSDAYGDGWNGGYLEIAGRRYCEDFGGGHERQEILAGAWEASGTTGEMTTDGMTTAAPASGTTDEMTTATSASATSAAPTTDEMTTAAPGGQCFTVTTHTGQWAYEMSWTIGGECSKSSSVTFQDHQIYEQTCCAQYFSGLTVHCVDAYGDGWNGGYLEIAGRRYCEDFGGGHEREEILAGAWEGTTAEAGTTAGAGTTAEPGTTAPGTTAAP